MSISILICFISGIFWACFDLTRKLSLKYIHPRVLLILLMLVQILIFFIWCAKESFFFNPISYFIPGIFSVLTGVLAALIFLKSLKESEISLTIPLLSLSPLFSSLFSWIFLGEALSQIQYAGILIIIAGILILYSEKLKFVSFLKSITNLKNNKSAKLMVVVAFFWSFTPVLDKMCLQHSSINIHGLVQAFCIFGIMLIFSIKELKVLNNLKKNNYILILFTVSIGASAIILQFFSITLTYVPIMESIKRATGQFGALVFGKMFFNENITEQKILGVIIISTGVYLLI